MNGRLTRFFAVAAFFILFFAPSLSGAEDEAPLVNAIEIKGLRKVDETLVREKLGHKVGEPFSALKLEDDIKNLYAMGRFEDVKAASEMFEGGIRLIYELTEKPTISRVEFFGNKDIDDSEIDEELGITHGTVADVVLMEESAEKIRKLYESKGYSNALVLPVVRKVTAGRVLLTYQIKEGEKVGIKEIKIEGNKNISSRAIKGAMKTKRRGLFSFITGSGYYDKSRLDEDMTRIKDLYYDHGYINVSVSEPIVGFVEDRKRMEIAMRLAEGWQYRISEVGIAGSKVFTEEELKGLIKTAPGKVFSKQDLREDVSALSDRYMDRGYATSSIIPDVVPDEAAKEARVAFRVSEGGIYHVGRIEITGNQKTRDRVIRRELSFNEGDVFNGSLLRRSYQRVYNLNFFEEVKLKPVPYAETGTIDIEMEVKERPSGMLSVGGGYSSIDRWVGTIDITEGNLLGRGQTVKAKAEFSERSTLYELSFHEPWLLGRPVSFSASVYNTSRKYTDYSKLATGFSLGLGKGFKEYWRTGAAYRLEYATIEDIAAGAAQFIKDQEGTTVTSSISPYVSRDTRDNYLDPHTGNRYSLSVTYAGLGGDNYFFKGTADAAWFYPIKSTTFSVRGRYGYAAGLLGRNLPLYERFYVGGIYTVRGLGFGDAGPPNRIGGSEELVLSAEYVFPLIEEARLKGVTFYDVGSAFEEGVDVEELRQTAGLGIRWITPVGPLRLEWGKNLYPKAGEKDSRWEFAFGTFF